MRLIKPGLPPDGERRPWLRGADSYLKKMIWRFEYLTLMSEIQMNFTFSCLFFIYIKVHIYFKSCWGLHFPYLYGALSPAHATDCLFWTCYPGWNLLRRNRRSKRQFWKPPSDSFVEARHSLHLNILLLRHSLGTRRGFSPISGRGINFFPENKSVNWAELGFHNLCFSHKFIHKKCFPEDQVHNKQRSTGAAFWWFCRIRSSCRIRSRSFCRIQELLLVPKLLFVQELLFKPKHMLWQENMFYLIRYFSV